LSCFWFCGKVIANSKLLVLSYASPMIWARRDLSFLEDGSILGQLLNLMFLRKQ
jgi:hypothetical protein